jgi:hypothetical protein
MTAPFPAGVADPIRRVAFIRLAGDELVAVDLGNGEVLWRRVVAGRPIGATAAGLVTISRSDRGADVAILDAQTGATHLRVKSVPVPDWVTPELDRTDAFTATTHEKDGDIEIVWKARRLYREGIAPQNQTDNPTEVTGCFVITSGSTAAVEPSTTALKPAEVRPEPHFEALMEATLGNHQFALESVPAGAGELSVILKARDQNSGSTLWEREIKRQHASRPPPRRM